MPGQLFVISAPSGTGKSTIAAALKERIAGLGYSVSHTSRRPRNTERDGVDYHFVERDTFRKMVDQGAFVEWATVYEDYYGTSFSSLEGQTERGLDVLLDIDSQGARNIRRHFEDSVLIYVLPPSLEVLERRLRDRGTDEESVIRSRMEKAAGQIRDCLEYDYVVINEELDRAVQQVEAIIMAERCRVRRRASELRESFEI